MKNKLFKFSIGQIFILIGISVSHVKCESKTSSIAAENVTHFDRSFQKVLSRRKRFLLWRPGSNVLVGVFFFDFQCQILDVKNNLKTLLSKQLTASLVKPLAFPRPGGHNLALEWDIFYPLPSSWYKPTKPTKSAPKPQIPPAPEIIEYFDPHGNQHGDPHSGHAGEIWIPSGGWSPDSDVIKTLSEAEAKGKRRVWSAEVNVNYYKFGWHKLSFLLINSNSDQTIGTKIIHSNLPHRCL